MYIYIYIYSKYTYQETQSLVAQQQYRCVILVVCPSRLHETSSPRTSDQRVSAERSPHDCVFSKDATPDTLPIAVTNIAPENQRFEVDEISFWDGLFSGAYASFRQGKLEANDLNVC